jgi:hypothetical protein
MNGKWANNCRFAKTCYKMKRLLILAAIVLTASNASAQKNYFIYLQADNKQNFYVKVNGKILSSSSMGYLLIPKLQTGNYNFVVGFPKDEWKQQNFNIAVNETDAGYALKNFGEQGWGLYNFQDMKVVMNDKVKEKNDLAKKLENKVPNANIVVVTTKDVIPEPFKETQIEKVTVPVQETKAVEVVKEKPADVITDKKNIVVPTALTTIKKIDTQRQKEGLQIRYKIDDGNTNEIVSILIENVPIENVKSQGQLKDKNEKFLDIELQNPNEKSPVKTDTKSEESKPDIITNKQIIYSNGCKEQANNDDFTIIRKKILSADSEPAMVAVADKYFKQKCYSVEQIKNLTALFLSNKGRYSFLDLAYLYTTDADNFASLEKLLTDEYYVKRFKAMLRN